MKPQPQKFDLDLGDGHWLEWMYADAEHTQLVGASIPHLDQQSETGMCGAGIFIRNEFYSSRVVWEFDGNRTAPTFSPSLRCMTCGDHGWIQNGRWVRAADSQLSRPGQTQGGTMTTTVKAGDRVKFYRRHDKTHQLIGTVDSVAPGNVVIESDKNQRYSAGGALEEAHPNDVKLIGEEEPASTTDASGADSADSAPAANGASKPAAGSADPAECVTEHHLNFLQFHGYAIKTIEEAKNFVRELTDKIRPEFLRAADAWRAERKQGADPNAAPATASAAPPANQPDGAAAPPLSEQKS